MKNGTKYSVMAFENFDTQWKLKWSFKTDFPFDYFASKRQVVTVAAVECRAVSCRVAMSHGPTVGQRLRKLNATVANRLPTIDFSK